MPQPQLYACPACAGPMSLQAPACPRCGQPNQLVASKRRNTRINVLVVSGILAAIAFVWWRSSTSSMVAEAAVECRSAGALLNSGMTCSIEHRSGTVPVHVCWTMRVTCANGTAGSGDGCGDVQPRAKVTTTMPYSAFRGTLDNCDTATGSSVDNLRLTPR